MYSLKLIHCTTLYLYSCLNWEHCAPCAHHSVVNVWFIISGRSQNISVCVVGFAEAVRWPLSCLSSLFHRVQHGTSSNLYFLKAGPLLHIFWNVCYQWANVSSSLIVYWLRSRSSVFFVPDWYFTFDLSGCILRMVYMLV